MFSFEPKNERNSFLNSALAFKMGQIKKMKALYLLFLFIENIFNLCLFSILFFNECTGLFYDFLGGCGLIESHLSISLSLCSPQISLNFWEEPPIKSGRLVTKKMPQRRPMRPLLKSH